MFKKLSSLAAAVVMASPLVAQYNSGWQMPYGYNPSFWDGCDQRFFAEVDYLLWYGNQEGLSFASTFDLQSTVTGRGGNTSGVSSTKDEFFRNNWDSGVRAFLGYKPACRSWDVRAGYTYFSGCSRRGFDPFTLTLTTTPNTTISGSTYLVDYVPLVVFSFLESNVGTIVSNLSAKWTMNFNQADIEFGREFYVACDVTLRPFFGMRGLFENQKYSVVNTLNNTLGRGSGFVSLTFNPKEYFNGFGARAGFDATVTVWGGLDLYGDISGSIIWGRSSTHQQLVVNDVSTGSSPSQFTYQTISHSHQTSVLNLDFGLGLRWNEWLNCGQNLLTLKFGWEQHLYTNINQYQNHFVNFDDVGSSPFDHNVYRGDLSLSGFVFGVAYLY